MPNPLNRLDHTGDPTPLSHGRLGRLLSKGLSGNIWGVRFVIALVALGIFAAFLSDERSVAGALGFSSDDVWIHFRFAQNLISGHGFSYNADQPVAGSTAPLWTLICAGFIGVLGDPVWAGKAAGFLCWILVLWGIFGLVMQLSGSRLAAGAATLLVLLHPRVIWGALSGLEVMLYSAIVIGALILHFRAADDPHRPYVVVTVLLMLGGLTRPELFSLVPLFWFDRWWLGHARESRSGSRWREIGISAGAGAVLLAPYFAFNFWTIGRPFPLTFYAKVPSAGLLAAWGAGDPIRVVAGVFSDGYLYLLRSYGYFLCTELPAMIGCWFLWWNLGRSPVAVRRKMRLLLIIPLYYLLVSAIFTGGVQGAFGRYLMFLFPLFGVIAVIAVWQWHHSQPASSRRFFAASAVLAVALGIAVVSAIMRLSPVKLFWLVMYPFVNSMPDSVRVAITDGQFLSGQLIVLLLAPFLAGVGGVLWAVVRPGWRRWVAGALWSAWGIIAICTLLSWVPICSVAVKNINDLNVAAGKCLDANLPLGATVAVNDIGAIGYFAGRRHIYDLMGLVEPDILPYRRRGEQGIWEYLALKRPDYLAVFDTWFPTVVQHTDVLEKVYSIHAENYTLWGYHTISIYRAHWERSDSGLK